MDIGQLKVAIIGAGNLATHLALALHLKKIVITEIYSRDVLNAKILGKKVNALQATDCLSFSTSNADVFFISVPDDAIKTVLENSIFPNNANVVHTSGSMPLSIKSTSQITKGVFYPLQTFSKNKPVDFSRIPICVESQSKKLHQLLCNLGEYIGYKVYEINSENRRHLHLAAVFACNFTNYLLGTSKEILNQKSIPFEILEPLVLETMAKSFEIGPEQAQTGPARRGDIEVIQKQMSLIANDKSKKQIYQLITEGIIKKAL